LQIDHDLIFAAFRFVILAEAGAKLDGFGANYSVDPRIV
jgi:hypothetical protein